MMAPSKFRKVLGLLGILVLLLSSTGDALGLHRCAHHDALPAADADDGASHHSHHPAPAEDEESSGCTCVGTCSISSVAIAARINAAQVDVVPTTFVALLPAPVFATTLSAAHLLPWSTAPPVL